MAATPQSSDERLNKIANTLMLARAAMAGNAQSSVLVDLSDDDTAFFEASLSSGEYLNFLDRNPQFSALDAADAPALTWDEYAAAGQSVEDFVNSFRRADLAAEGASTAVPALHGSDETVSTIKAESQPAKNYQKFERTLSAARKSLPKVAIVAEPYPIFKGLREEDTLWFAEEKPTPLIHTPLVGTHADAFADDIRPYAKDLLSAALSNPRKDWVELSSPVDLRQLQRTMSFIEVLGHLAIHAGMPREHMYEAALSWLNEVNSGQMTGHADSVEYL